MDKKIITSWPKDILFQQMVSSVKLLSEDFLRFVLLAIIVLVSGSIGIAFAFGQVFGTVIIAMVILFTLGALYFRTNPKNQRYHKKQN